MKKPKVEKLTRVKYYNENGIYTSHKEFLGSGGTLLNVQINTSNRTVSVLQASGELYSVIESSPYETFTEAKVSAKRLLEKYGVQFFAEVRKKKVIKKLEESSEAS
jgi:hypothetical protein